MPQGAKPWEWALAQATHGILYLLVLAASITGWLLAGTFRQPLDGTLLGLITVPMLTHDASLHRPMEEAHEVLSYALLALIVFHVAAALRHHFMLRNDVLRRMGLRRLD
jgi:cytochrome b561